MTGTGAAIPLALIPGVEVRTVGRWLAAMGPRPRGRGDLRKAEKAGAVPAMLQRGRALEGAETPATSARKSPLWRLQRGRALEGAKTPSHPGNDVREIPASTGPRLGRCGDGLRRARENAVRNLLQRGRALEGAETTQRTRTTAFTT